MPDPEPINVNEGDNDGDEASAQKRPISDVDGATKSPQSQRHTWTTKAIANRKSLDKDREDVGMKVRQLDEKWKCGDSNCDNERRWCWREDRIHYPINDWLQKETWAHAWLAEETDERTPPSKLKAHLKLKHEEREKAKKEGSKKERELQKERDREEQE